MTTANEMVDVDQIMAELQALAARSDSPAPSVTRVLFTEADLAGRAYITELCKSAGLTVREDPIGNLFARWEGQRPDLAPIGTGSHIDAIPDSGRFDGTVGVLGGLAAIRTLQRVGYEPVRPIELLMFTCEEPTRFGIGCLGSRALSGALSADAMTALKDADGKPFDELRRSAGFHGDLTTVRLPANYFAAFVELHIEQGPDLERAGLPIGVVTAIAAPASLRVTWLGEGGHAGAALMSGRRDALCAAAEAVLAVEAAATSRGGLDTVATTGVCRVHPGAINSIADRVIIEIDVRDIDLARRDKVLQAIREAIEAIAIRRHVAAAVECLNADPPAKTSEVVVGAIQSSCGDLRLKALPMISRAYHDSLFMARITPTGMIFIPCRGGVSHRPDEYSSPEAIARGVEVLALSLGQLAVRRCRARSCKSRALKCSGDRAVRFIGRKKNLIGVFQSKGPQIDEDAMLVGHDQGDPLDLGTRIERGRAHGVERLLHGETLVGGKCLEQGLASAGVGLIPMGVVAIVEPVGPEHRGQDPVGRVTECRVPVPQEPAKRRVVRFEQEQLVETGLNAQARPIRAHGAGSRLARPAPKRVGMVAAVHANPLQGLFGQAHGRLRDVGMVGQKMARHGRAKVLDRFQRMLSGQRIRHVFHGVGGYHELIVAARVRAGEIALELDRDRHLADNVAIGQTGDLGQTNPRLSVRVLGQDCGHDQIPPHRTAACCNDDRS